jgi:hypothetical protein
VVSQEWVGYVVPTLVVRLGGRIDEQVDELCKLTEVRFVELDGEGAFAIEVELEDISVTRVEVLL